MDAEATDLLTRSTVKLRCSDISVSDCYLETLNPMDLGTPVWVRLVRGGHVFESQGKVADAVPRLGMGVAFAQPVPTDQMAVLSDWLAEAGASSNPQPTLFGSSASR
jgi:hypothetical protein